MPRRLRKSTQRKALHFEGLKIVFILFAFARRLGKSNGMKSNHKRIGIFRPLDFRVKAKEETLNRIVKNFYTHGCMGDFGSLNKEQRKSYLMLAIQKGYITPECGITQAGKELASELA